MMYVACPEHAPQENARDSFDWEYRLLLARECPDCTIIDEEE